MNIKDIENLIRDDNQDGLYDLFSPTFAMLSDPTYKVHLVEFEEDMRIDMLSQNIYGSTQEVDILLSYNDIDNPLNIMIGDLIKYPPSGTIADFRLDLKQSEENRRRLTNPNKTTRKDSSRTQYVEQNYSLPPTVTKEPRAQVKIEGNELVIGS